MQGSTVMRQRSAETLAPEEPYALIAHVRVCGGGAPFNGIRDRSRRELRVDSGVRGTQHASRRGTTWGVKPVDNGPTSASHTAAERATPAIEADVKEPAEASSQTTGASG